MRDISKLMFNTGINGKTADKSTPKDQAEVTQT